MEKLLLPNAREPMYNMKDELYMKLILRLRDSNPIRHPAQDEDNAFPASQPVVHDD
jgi:hypothetical protein